MSLCFFSYTRCQKWFQAMLGRALTLTAMRMTDLSSASQVSGGANRHLHAWRAALTMDERGACGADRPGSIMPKRSASSSRLVRRGPLRSWIAHLSLPKEDMCALAGNKN